MEELTREELDYLYVQPKKDGMNKRVNGFIGVRAVELMILIGLFIFLWDKVLKYNLY